LIEKPLEHVLALIPCEERRPRTERERKIEIEQAKEVALVIAAFEALNDGDHSLRELADGLLDSETLRGGFFSWEQRATLGPWRAQR
jgi:hypothetical protein